VAEDRLAVAGAREPEAKLDRADDADEQGTPSVAAARGLAKGRLKDAESKSEADAGGTAQKKQAFGATTGSATDARERRERWRATPRASESSRPERRPTREATTRETSSCCGATHKPIWPMPMLCSRTTSGSCCATPRNARAA
jgi:hypothetical protein